MAFWYQAHAAAAPFSTALLHRLGAVHEGEDTGLGVDEVTDRIGLLEGLAVRLEQGGHGLDRQHQGHAEDTDAELAGDPEALFTRAGRPHRRVGLLERLGDHGQILDLDPVAVPGECVLGPHLGDHPHGVDLLLAGLIGIDLEGAPLRDGRAGESHLEPAVAEQVERRRPLGDADRVVDVVGGEGGGVADADPAGPLGDRRQDDLGGRAVAHLDRPVVLDLPPASVPIAVGQLGLGECLLQQLLLLPPLEAGLLHFAEDVDLHTDLPKDHHDARRRPRSGSDRESLSPIYRVARPPPRSL